MALDDRVKRAAGDFCADVRLDLDLICGEVEARGAVDAVGIEKRHGGHFEVRADCDQFLGQGGAFEKAESRAGVEFDVQKFSVPSSQLKTFSFRILPEN
jgi:hypothetical protein